MLALYEPDKLSDAAMLSDLIVLVTIESLMDAKVLFAILSLKDVD
ncbi:hypothetical protein ACFOLE_04820 [Staphylococcus piscifermentans]|nr:hypothetical protein [Staphylococcus piscifermentans]